MTKLRRFLDTLIEKEEKDWKIKEIVVRQEGLEPPHLSAPEPKSGVSTNSTTGAGGHIVAASRAKASRLYGPIRDQRSN